MTKRKHLKRRVRQRAAKTGESYTAALPHLRATSEERHMSNPDPTTVTRSCSFCRKRQDEVKKLIAGPGVYICDECIGLSNDIISAEDAPEKAPTLEDGPVERLLGIFTAMVETSRTMEDHLAQWAQKLTTRGATPARIAAAAGLTEAEATERFGL